MTTYIQPSMIFVELPLSLPMLPLDLSLPMLPIRTHKAVCPCCFGRSETTDSTNRVVMCYECASVRVSKL